MKIFVNDEEVNKVSAIWQKKKDDVKKEEYDEFYKFISNDWQEPLGHLHISIEGKINFEIKNDGDNPYIDFDFTSTNFASIKILSIVAAENTDISEVKRILKNHREIKFIERD